MSIVSSTSGRTSTEANEVCRRALESNGLIRTRRWTPGLAAEIAVGVLALDVDGRLLDAGRAAVFAVGDLGLEPLGLGPHQVHPQQHLGPVAGLGAARAGVDRHEGVAVVVRPAEHRAELERVEVAPPPACRPSRISSSNSSVSASSASSIVASRLSAWRTSSSNGLRTDVEALQLLDDRLGLLLVVPERRAVHLLLERVAMRLACRRSQRESRSWRICSITPLAVRFSSGSTGGS